MRNILLLLVLSSLSGCFHAQPSITTGFEGKPMPSFNLLLMDSITHLNTSAIPFDKPIVLFYFSPYCPFCRAETEQIIAEIKSLKNIRFYLFSNFPFALIKQYADQFQLNKYPNITVGQDPIAYFGDYYKATGVPYIAVYQKNKRLRQVLIGKVDTDVIKDIAFQ